MRWANNIASGLMALAISCHTLDIDHRLSVAATQPVPVRLDGAIHLTHEETDSPLARFRWGAAAAGIAVIVVGIAVGGQISRFRRGRSPPG